MFEKFSGGAALGAQVSGDALPCRDCGYQLEPAARGCPQCALNVEAETMIDRFIWRRFLPGMILLAVLAAGALVYIIR